MKKKQLLQLSMKIGLALLLVIGFALLNEDIYDRRKREFTPTDDYKRFVYQIDDLSIVDNELVIKGWFLQLRNFKNQELTIEEDKKIGVLLYDVSFTREKNSDGSLKPCKGINMDVEYVDRQDVDEYFKCGYDYSNCGFIAKIDLNTIDMEKTEYQIVFKTDTIGNVGVLSSVFIRNGKLNYLDKKDDLLLNVEDTDLKDIISKGICVCGSKEHHIWIYQYGLKLYWIADKQYAFNDEGKTLIQYQLNTTQYDKLPKNRTDNGWYWDNLGDYFENYEITQKINCGEYRVSVRDIPQNYSITGIETGYFINNEWVWKRYFYPSYNQLLEKSKLG